jgi:hypothetical protein
LFSFSILQGWKIGQFLQRKKKSKFSWKNYTEKADLSKVFSQK